MAWQRKPSSAFDPVAASRGRRGSDPEKEAYRVPHSFDDNGDEEESPASFSSRTTSSSYSPMLKRAFSRRPRAQYLQKLPNSLMRWLCFALLSTLIIFIITLVRLSWMADKQIEIEIEKQEKAPPPPPPWESFPFLERYFGGVRALVSRNSNMPEYPRDLDESKSEDPAFNETISKRSLMRTTAFTPYPSYASEEYVATYGKKADCFLDLEGEVKIPSTRVYAGVPNGFPDAVMGSNSLLGVQDDVCFDRFGRLGPYGLGYSLNRGGSGAQLEGDREGADDVWLHSPEVDYRKAQWAKAQERCVAANKHRFADLPSPPRIDRFRAMPVGSLQDLLTELPNSASTSTTKLPRTAVVIRTWWDFKYTPEDLIYLRSIISELSLASGGEYIVHFLVQVKDDNAPIWSDDETYERILHDSLPEEFRGMGTLWSERQMGLVYGGLEETFMRDLPVHGVYRSTFMPMQFFAYQHPEYDYFWNWEMDVRYTGHWYHLFDSVTKWAKQQPRKGLWERNGRFYIPSEHGSWEDFKQMVRVNTEQGTNSPNNMWSGLKAGGVKGPGDVRAGDKPVWGPERPEDDKDDEDNEVAFDTDPVPPTTHEKDKYSWGVGEEADLITFNPLFDPDGTTWLLAEDVTGYNKTRGVPPRRAAIITASRLSRRLLMTMHRETSLERHHMFSEMWPASCALHHGLKAVYAPHSEYIDRRWPTSYLKNVFNAGRNGATGGARTSVFGDREHNFRGTTWYYNAGFPEVLWNRWLGYKFNNEGGEQFELANEGRMCLPPMLLHPIKRIDLVIEEFDYPDAAGSDWDKGRVILCTHVRKELERGHLLFTVNEPVGIHRDLEMDPRIIVNPSEALLASPDPENPSRPRFGCVPNLFPGPLQHPVVCPATLFRVHRSMASEQIDLAAVLCSARVTSFSCARQVIIAAALPADLDATDNLGSRSNWGGQGPSSSLQRLGRGRQLSAFGVDQSLPYSQQPSIRATAEDDWISPFTQQPLPSTKQSHGDSNRLSSPPRHRKSSSGAYYAAAWGSPITPETGRHIGPFSSPDRRETHSYLVRSRHSERGNWLSDSESSVHSTPRPAQPDEFVEDWLGLESDDQSETATRTPTLGSFIKSRKNITGRGRSVEPGPGHRMQDSTATIKQVDYWTRGGDMATAQSAPDNTEKAQIINPALVADKPLPPPPEQLDGVSNPNLPARSPLRRQMSIAKSFQRPKTKLLWKGKACIIAVPLDDCRGSEDAPLLTPADVQARLGKWEREGYNTAGFVLSDMLASNSSGRAGGQSRDIHPDPADILAERRSHGYRVSIPDRAEWDAWMEFLKEERLRALGVTTSDSEPPPSARSPFSSNMSRASSQYPNLPFSPPQPPSSVGSSHAQNGHIFSPHVNPSTGASSHASPSLHFGGLPGPTHRYKQSLAYPPMEVRLTSSPNYPLPLPIPPASRQQSPPHYFSQRRSSVSPAAVGGMSSLGEILSPVSPFPGENYNGHSQPSVTLDRMRRQQQELQAQMLRQQQQQIIFNQSGIVNGPSVTLDTEKRFRTRVEIAHPTPRPHQRNLSEALQREIDEAETLVERETQGPSHVDESSGNISQKSASHHEAIAEATTTAPNPKLEVAMASQNTEAADQSEIETNPSLHNSPMPRRQVHSPSQLPEPLDLKSNLPPSISMVHKVKPSASKLNVQAKEFKFDPKATFVGSNFHVGSNAFQPAATTVQLNAAAPEFQPSMIPPFRTTADKFSFSSAAFNVGAPVFNPSASVSSHVESSIASGSDDPSSATSKIFGRVNLDPSSKTTRRSSKALTIIKPSTDESDLAERDRVEDDQDGRLGPSLARLKRARRRGSDGDQEAVYAPHNEQTLTGQDTANNEPIAVSSTDNAPPKSPDMDKQSLPEQRESIDSKEEVDAPTLNSAKPPESIRPITASASSIAAELVAPPSTASHRPKPSLSASAPPFIPASVQQGVVGTGFTPEPAKSRKSMGLEASRFAATPSPPASPPLPISLADADKLDEVSELTATADDEPKPRQELQNSRILEEILSQAHISDAEKSVPLSGTDEGLELTPATDDVPEARHGLRNSSILQKIISEGHVSDAEKSLSVSEIEEGSVRSASELTPVSRQSDHFREAMPSYAEIDEVMKQLQNDPELGVERLATPPVRSSPARTPQLHSFSNICSDAPSPSPRMMQRQDMPQEKTAQNLELSFKDPEPGLEFPVRKLNGHNDAEISDWNAEVSSPDAQKLQSRAQFFDAHVVDLVGGILDNRVGPMERTLNTIQHSLAVMATRPTSSRRERRSLSTHNKDSDADDEDDFDDLDTITRYQTRSPTSRKDQRTDWLKITIQEALAAQKAQSLEAQGPDLSALPEMLAEMRQLAQQFAPESRQSELKAVVEEVIGTHPRLRGHRVQQSHDFGGNEEKSKLQINGLESMLKMASERADHEAKARREAEDALADALRRLRYAKEEAAHHRESSEEAERTLIAYHKEKESLENLEETVSQLSLKNAALETTLAEYRLSSDQWRDDIRDEQIKNRELRHTIHSLKQHLEESAESKQALRSKVDRLQEHLTAAARDIAADRALSRKQELELTAKNEHMQQILDHEIRRREKCELELDELDKEHKQNIHFRDRCAHLQQENSRLEQAMAALTQDCKAAQDVAFQAQRELQHVRESIERQVRQATSGLEADLKLANSQASIVRADLEAKIARLQDSLEHAELDAVGAKAKHDALFEETLEAHNQALQQAREEKEAALQNQQSAHEKKLNDLRERHTRALHNSSDDRHRLEQHLNEKLALSDDKVQHLESKVADLQERLEITKSAARAAAEAATSKGINLPTPASSVVASPPHSTIASMPLVKGSDLPEKISPQALRESIMVLQDQLQNREQKIEQLEAELAKVDREAPTKIKDRDTEITWLRELLCVRIDELEDIIKTLSQEEYDRQAVRDAAIRLHANLQMEQQEKERAASGVSNSFPSIASLSTLTQSPRALPMAAAAAWGNWRKARDSSLGALADLTNLGNQTPSRSTYSGTPQSFLAGLMTPPSTNQRPTTPTVENTTAPSTMMSLGASGRKTSGEARPLRAYNSQVRSLSARQMEKRSISTTRMSGQQPSTHPEPPSTPPLMRRGSYDGDADVRSISGDVDADASLIGPEENMPSGDSFSEGEVSIRS